MQGDARRIDARPTATNNCFCAGRGAHLEDIPGELKVPHGPGLQRLRHVAVSHECKHSVPRLSMLTAHMLKSVDQCFDRIEARKMRGNSRGAPLVRSNLFREPFQGVESRREK